MATRHLDQRSRKYDSEDGSGQVRPNGGHPPHLQPVEWVRVSYVFGERLKRLSLLLVLPSFDALCSSCCESTSHQTGGTCDLWLYQCIASRRKNRSVVRLLVSSLSCDGDSDQSRIQSASLRTPPEKEDVFGRCFDVCVRQTVSGDDVSGGSVRDCVIVSDGSDCVTDVRVFAPLWTGTEVVTLCPACRQTVFIHNMQALK